MLKVANSINRILINNHQKKDILAKLHHKRLISRSFSSANSQKQEEHDVERSQNKKSGQFSDVDWADKIIYSSYLQKFQPNRSYRYRAREKALEGSMEAVERLGKTLTSPPIAWKYLSEDAEQKQTVNKSNKTSDTKDKSNDSEPMSSTTFPFQNVTKTEFVSEEEEKLDQGHYESEAQRLSKAGVNLKDILTKSANELRENEMEHQIKLDQVRHDIGTPDLSIPSSKIPCGGCGAFLHCKDTSIPGYVSSERFKTFERNLKSELCLRCYSLENYNTALSINISPEDYPKVLHKIDKKFAMVLLVVDLTDFPCSIWPGIVDIIGTKRPVILVGNKIDLIPRDSEKCLDRIQKALLKSAREAGLDASKIIHTSIVSAATGYGIEDLISKIFYLWNCKGDVYIMGCTNVGKSSLFNALIKSDLCKSKVADFVKSATISQWPGTTLNLLKFPLMRPTKFQIFARNNRINEDARTELPERVERYRMLKQTRDPNYGVLTGTIGRTFIPRDSYKEMQDPMVLRDPFLHSSHPPKNIPQPGAGDWDPDDPYIQGHWCFDTPGAVNENQILDILTLPELMKVLPKKIIEPRTYFIKVGMSFFVGGIARIDYLEGFKPIRYTTFCSEHIPITIVQVEDADDFYNNALANGILGIPEINKERLSKFPALRPRDFILDGEGHDHSCSDIVLSSAGWVAVSVAIGKTVKLRVHTPEGKGLFLRRPSILPFSVNSKGPRIRGTLAYLPHRVYVPNKNAKT